MFFFPQKHPGFLHENEEENNEIESQFTFLGGLNFYFKEDIPFALSVIQVKLLYMDQD